MLHPDTGSCRQGDSISAAIAASFLNRCNGLDLDLGQFRTTVETRILETEKMLRKLISRFSSSSGNFDEGLSLTPKFKLWAQSCNDAVSFGQMMCWLDVQLVIATRYLIHESAGFQLFAYICECARIRGRKMTATLEALFNDPRVTPFLFMDGRPRTLDDCYWGIEKWSDPSSVSSLTPYIYNARNKPILTKEITENKGALTHVMVSQLGTKTLEQYLQWELDIDGSIRLEELATVAVSVMGERSTDHADQWYYLRSRVLKSTKLEEKLINVFEQEEERRHQGPI
ncbi:MAG: hypothetical protein LQ346_007180 [Caloplaca aetnensis]|nr:MAG: hypothetical protein LQ346_007180 [Caloplaca aetnensis]